MCYNESMTKSLRDSQRSKVYKAEGVIHYPAKGKRYESMSEVTAYVERVCDSKFWKKLNGYYVKVEDGRGRRTACASDWGTINLPKWARQDSVILHELAHTLVNFDYHNPVPSHGKEFAKMYLILVKRFMGKEAHDTLRDSFKKHNVHYIIRGG
jgi:putative metallohydrolase (TIGR04338 family)